MSNKPVIESLKKALADTYTLYLKTQNYHWNVEGERFRSLHLMFEEQYTALAAVVDSTAERIRALGEKAPGTYAEFVKLSTIKEGDSSIDENQMVKDLYLSHQQMIATLKKVIAAAEKAEDPSTEDFAIARIAEHEKTAWMLKASIPADIKAKLKIA